MSEHYDWPDRRGRCLMPRIIWPDDATLLVDLDLRRGVRQADGRVPLLERVHDVLHGALTPYDVEVRQNGKGDMIALRWPVDDFTIELIAAGVAMERTSKRLDAMSPGGRAFWIREARRFAEYGLQAVKLGGA